MREMTFGVEARFVSPKFCTKGINADIMSRELFFQKNYENAYWYFVCNRRAVFDGVTNLF